MSTQQHSSGSPVACGALGDFDPAAVASVARSMAGTVREVHRAERATLWLDRAPIRWSGPDGELGGLAWPESVPEEVETASSIGEAAAAGACGLAWSPGAVFLHGSGSGVAPLYWLRVGDATYFATALDPLVRSGVTRVSPDWEAWASIITLSYPQEGRTPFSEVRRMEPGQHIRVGRPGSHEVGSNGFPWTQSELGPEEAAERIAIALRAKAAEVAGQGPVLCPLSGGWDSRLLAALLAEVGALAGAYTVNTEAGHTAEEDIARAVAGALGVPHRIIQPPADRTYAQELEQAAARLEYQSMLHFVMHRLCDGMPSGGVCADGFALDAFVKGRWENDPRPAARQFQRIAPRRMARLFPDPVWRAMRDPTRAAFNRGMRRFDGHPSQVTLGFYWTRTHRAIGSSPASVLGRRYRVFMPGVAESVAAPALAVRAPHKEAGALYRRVYQLISPTLGAMPSTNDRPLKAHPEASVHCSPQANQAHWELLARSPLRPWFSEAAERDLRAQNVGSMASRARLRLRVQSVCTFTLWAERYRDLIGEIDPSPMLGGMPGRRRARSRG